MRTYILILTLFFSLSCFSQFTGGIGRGDTSMMITNTPLACEHLVNTSIKICQGDSLIVGTNVYSQDGIYYDTLTSVNGCDSVIITDLTVNLLPPMPSMYHSGDTVFSTVMYGNQWYDTLGPIPGANNYFYIPTVSGFYWVRTIDSAGCVSPAPEPIWVEITSVLNISNVHYLTVYPNPANDYIVIKFPNPDNSSYIFRLYNIKGEIVLTKTQISAGKFELQNVNLQPGLYSGELSGKQMFRFKVAVK